MRIGGGYDIIFTTMRAFIDSLLSPVMWGIILALGCCIALACACHIQKTRQMKAKKIRIYTRWIAIGGAFWVLFFSTPFGAMFCAMDLEETFKPRDIETLPTAEVVVLPGDPQERGACVLNAQQAKHILEAGKATKVAFLSDAPETKKILAEMNVSPDVVASFDQIDKASTNDVIVVSDAWRMLRVAHETQSMLSQARLIPVAYGHMLWNKDFRLEYLLPSVEGAALTQRALKGVFEIL